MPFGCIVSGCLFFRLILTFFGEPARLPSPFCALACPAPARHGRAGFLVEGRLRVGVVQASLVFGVTERSPHEVPPLLVGQGVPSTSQPLEAVSLGVSVLGAHAMPALLSQVRGAVVFHSRQGGGGPPPADRPHYSRQPAVGWRPTPGIAPCRSVGPFDESSPGHAAGRRRLSPAKCKET